jgi:hypothetical protein
MSRILSTGQARHPEFGDRGVSLLCPRPHPNCTASGCGNRALGGVHEDPHLIDQAVGGERPVSGWPDPRHCVTAEISSSDASRVAVKSHEAHRSHRVGLERAHVHFPGDHILQLVVPFRASRMIRRRPRARRCRRYRSAASRKSGATARHDVWMPRETARFMAVRRWPCSSSLQTLLNRVDSPRRDGRHRGTPPPVQAVLLDHATAQRPR